MGRDDWVKGATSWKWEGAGGVRPRIGGADGGRVPMRGCAQRCPGKR